MNSFLTLETGTVLRKRYTVKKILDQNDFEIRYLAWDQVLCAEVEIKEYFPMELCTRRSDRTEIEPYAGTREEQFREGYGKFLEEARALAGFPSLEGILRVMESFEANGTVYVVQDHVEGQTLEHILEEGKRYHEQEAVALLQPVMRSLEKLHAAGILHRDIAPENFLIDRDGNARLMNFGAARFAGTSHSRSLSIMIRRGYSPEELYRSRDDKGAYTDVYGIGAVLYRMITGVVPPDALERRVTLERKRKDLLLPVRRFAPEVSEHTETAILNALNVKIEDRTADMGQFLREIRGEDKVFRKKNTIRKQDLFHWPLWARVSGAVGISAVLLFSVLFFTGVIGNFSTLQENIVLAGGMTRVPSIVNTELGDAEERIAKAQLLCGIADKEYSSEIKSDMVLSQDIDGGTIVEKNTVLGITVSGGMEQVLVPEVTGLAREAAGSILEEQGFSVSLEEDYSDVLAAGCVISQSPEGGIGADRGSQVTLVISRGPDPEKAEEVREVEVPGFTGLEFSQALVEAGKVRLLLKVTAREYSDQYAEGQVISQNMDPGTKVLSGTTVEITVSMGKEKVLVPDVTYMALDRAQAILADRGLTVVVSYQEDAVVNSNVIISQNLEKNSVVDKGAEIHLVVSKGQTPAKTPQNPGTTVTNTLVPTAAPTKAPTETPTSIPVSGVTLNFTEATLSVSETIALRASVLPSAAADKQVTWSSQDASVARVDSDGTVTAVSPGSTVITVVTREGGFRAQCTVHVEKAPVTLAGVAIASLPEKQEYYQGEALDTAGLVLALQYSDGSSEEISSGFTVYGDTSTVGSAEVQVEYKGFTAAYTIHVQAPVLTVTGPDSLVLGRDVSVEESCSLTVGESARVASFGSVSGGKGTFSAVSEPASRVSWSSSNPEILSVDDQGNARISSVQDGVWTVTVTAETDDGRTAAKEVSVLRQTQVSVSGYDSSVISVSEDGDGVTVSAVAAGSTAVTVSWGDSSRTVLISVS